jgi:hypothetical protein
MVKVTCYILVNKFSYIFKLERAMEANSYFIHFCLWSNWRIWYIYIYEEWGCDCLC